MAVDSETFNEFVAANRGLRQQVVEALAIYYWSLDMADAAAVVVALETVIPQLVEQYGEIATVLAADYFDLLRGYAGVAPLYDSILVPAELDDLGPSIGWAAEGLFGEEANPQDTLDRLTKVVDQKVKEAGTNTFTANVDRDPAKPLFARVPVGDTCPFCRMLGSQGFVYRDEHTARFGADGEKYHDNCDCQPVAEWDVTNPHLAGYDDEKYYSEYQKALENSNGGTVNDLMAGYRKVQAEAEGREYNPRGANREKASTTKKTTKAARGFGDLSVDQINHHISVTEALPDSDYKRKYLERLRTRREELVPA